ncbi:MAG: DUF1273 domain-containing protein, partial [Clostridia bacterium]|nr:DUF1273 domain-containing protein [Clostridia bacterium]
TDKDYYQEWFDKIVVPEELIGIHYKRAITERNYLMIDKSDYVLTSVYRSYGGANDAMKYAEKKGKLYKNILEK